MDSFRRGGGGSPARAAWPRRKFRQARRQDSLSPPRGPSSAERRCREGDLVARGGGNEAWRGRRGWGGKVQGAWGRGRDYGVQGRMRGGKVGKWKVCGSDVKERVLEGLGSKRE